MAAECITGGVVECPNCHRRVLFTIGLIDRTLSMSGAVFPVDQRVQNEFYRRGVPVLCKECWQGKEIKDGEVVEEEARIILP